MNIRFAVLPLMLSLAACTAANQARVDIPPPPPLRPALPLPPPAVAQRPAAPPPVRSAGQLTLASIGSYMDSQENDLRASLRGTGGLVTRPGDDLVVVLRNDLLFNGAQLSPRGSGVLAGIATILRRYDRSSIQVQGFTDTRGAPDRNLAVSDTRAKAVLAVMIQGGVTRNRISAQGFGETRPRIATADNVAELRNQRVEIRIIARPG